MIKVKDVIRLKMPHPNISSNLALYSHMYICYELGQSNKLIKAQTYKPLLENVVDNFIDSDEFINHHPFRRRTLIDLDKYFFINDVVFPIQLRANDNNGNVSDSLFNEINNKTNNLCICAKEVIDKEILKSINPAI
ncbi:TPA: hypothetical protein PEC87_002647 [Staphylococcus aureus]|uniref:hypothetical protein n=2 Tax=Staphylococcus aureus TaxID=1280 RepID=UPI0003D3D51D|nr:hypothetical protein [Staphylococcus aureus]AQD18916.1 hypothetical protein BZP34_06365 [Staphylococcus aureus]EJX2151514.1 hypothetical protein [Staphylococcus aureus]EKF1812948.1 hypothetical protein [Staphylococcus aureus]ETD14885.1 hypothetical protein HMPREF1276_00292 [Staphylococcus aureus subsp. aureus KPL1845]MBA6069678.1 hypothetical protein [Staphylococcus aureus]